MIDNNYYYAYNRPIIDCYRETRVFTSTRETGSPLPKFICDFDAFGSLISPTAIRTREIGVRAGRSISGVIPSSDSSNDEISLRTSLPFVRSPDGQVRKRRGIFQFPVNRWRRRRRRRRLRVFRETFRRYRTHFRERDESPWRIAPLF